MVPTPLDHNLDSRERKIRRYRKNQIIHNSVVQLKKQLEDKMESIFNNQRNDEVLKIGKVWNQVRISIKNIAESVITQNLYNRQIRFLIQ